VVDHIVAKADGVPLYVEELTKAILGSGVLEARGDVRAFFLAINARAHARESAAAIHMISLTFLTTWGQSGASGCGTINHWQLGTPRAADACFPVLAMPPCTFQMRDNRGGPNHR
jgi:hypothetical protein